MNKTMQKVIRVLMWILFVFALIILMAYLLPCKVEIERNATMNSSPKIVFSQINDLHNWEKWSKWHIDDTELKLRFINNGVGDSAGVIWESSHLKIDRGRLTIFESEPYSLIHAKIEFPDRRPAEMKFSLQKKGEETELNWILVCDVGYNPFARWAGLLKNKIVGPALQESLYYLTTVCEVLEEENALIVELTSVKPFYYAGRREKIRAENVSVKMGEMFDEVSAFIENSTAETAGMPFAIYHEIVNDSIDLECGFPVSAEIAPRKPFQTGQFPANTCATLSYFGNYQQLEIAHSTIQNWIETRKFKLAGPPIEMYATNPANEADPDKWHTKICYPVR
jgi:effector-binding domain-containing protein